MSNLDAVLKASKSRWQRGVDDFLKFAAGGSPGPKATTIRSAVYGNMHFDEIEMRFIESFYLQRLRGVSQMGLLNYVYPDARHSRFEHSLGALWSLKGLLEQDAAVNDHLKDEDKKALFVAALLHDCGHGPFSHTTESLLEMAGLDKRLRRPAQGELGKVKPHERRFRDMLRDKDFFLSELGLSSYGIAKALGHYGISVDRVQDLVLGKPGVPLINLVSGDFDVDKMDYFRRDAFFTGTLGGGVDMEAIQRWIRIHDDDGGAARAAFDSRVVGHLLHLLYSREHVYNITAYHPTARIVSSLLMVAGDLALRSLPAEDAAKLFTQIELLDDREFLAALEYSARDLDSQDAKLLQLVNQRILLRRLPKKLAVLTRSEFRNVFEAAIPNLENGNDAHDLPVLAYCKLSEIAGGRYSKLLKPGFAGDDVVMLELTPSLGSSVDEFSNCSRERSTLDEILVLPRTSKSPTSLTEWIDASVGAGAAEAHARSLRSYKLLLWRALVLVPASVRAAFEGNSAATQQFLQDFSAALANQELARPLGRTMKSWGPAVKEIDLRIKALRDQRPALP